MFHVVSCLFTFLQFNYKLLFSVLSSVDNERNIYTLNKINLSLEHEISNIKYQIIILFIIIASLVLFYQLLSCCCERFSNDHFNKSYYFGVKEQNVITQLEIKNNFSTQLKTTSDEMQFSDSDFSNYIDLLCVIDSINIILNNSLMNKEIKNISFKDFLAKSVMLDKFAFMFSIDLLVDYEFNALEYKNKIHLIRICQELLSNSLKYSLAENINISFVFEEGSYIFKYTDDGIGYDSQLCKYGNGMANIYARSIELNCQLDIYTSPNKGFKSVISCSHSFCS